MGSKIGTFSQFYTRVWTILGIEKVVFWTFLKLFWSCLGSVWALFSTLKGPLLGVFSTRKVDIWPLKSKFYVKNWPSERVILTIFGDKKLFFGLFEIGFGVFQEFFMHYFWPQKANFVSIFSLKLTNRTLTHSRSSPLGSRGCPTMRKIRRILLAKGQFLFLLYTFDPTFGAAFTPPPFFIKYAIFE